MMASPVPAKPHTLHNFPLPSLWSHRARRHSASSPPHRRLSPSASESEPDTRRIPRPDPTAQNPPPLRSSVSAPRPDLMVHNHSQPLPPPPSDRKICVKIRGADRSETHEERGEREENDEMEETLAKTWNFRPRKLIKRSGNKNGGLKTVVENKPINASNGGGDKKQKFSISLSKREIEEDLLMMTGSKPSRKPKKWSRTVQKNLDEIFPGLWLASVTPDSYKVNEGAEKP